MQILFALLLLLFQSRTAPGVLDKPDPAQIENAPPLGYQPVETGLSLPDGITLGASSGVAFDAQGHMWVLNRGQHLRLDTAGEPVAMMGQPGPGPALGEFGEAPNTDIYVADTINAKLHRFAKR